MATKFAVLSLATGVLSQAFAGAGSAPGSGAVGAGAGAGAGAAGAAGAAQPGPSIALPKPQTILPMFLPDVEPQPLVGSIVAAPNAQTTTVALACPAGEPAEACALPPGGITVTHMSGSVFQANYAAPLAPGKTASISWACTVTSVAGLPAAPTTLPPGMGAPSANAAVCALSAGGGSVSKSTTQTIAAPTMYGLVQAVGVTVGAEKLAATAGGDSASPAAGGAAPAGTTAAAAGGVAPATTATGASASLSLITSSISSEVAAKTSSVVASASKAVANASASVATATTAGAAQGHSKSAFLVSLVSAAVFGSLVYAL